MSVGDVLENRLKEDVMAKTRKPLQSQPSTPALDEPLAAVELDLRTVNALEIAYDAIYLRDLVKLSKAQIQAIPGFGHTTTHRIDAMLAARGLALRDS